MWTSQFWKETAERAVKSAAQALIGLWAMDGFNVLDIDSAKVPAGVALGAAILSVLTSIVTSGIGEPNDPSAVRR